MKLVRLLLQAFGPFTNKIVDFSSGPTDLHLIYGPNEAGKSSALRAMTDLRFGIPLRSPDDFVHSTGTLRIGGEFTDQSGQSVRLVRRKGRGATLARINVATEQPDPTLTIDSTLEHELTGGLERTEFEAMYGLNHARLREGGKLLLAGEGDLGSALFEASAGTRGIMALLATLDSDAKKLYSPHGRAQNAVINEARQLLNEQRQAWRQGQTKPADWQTLNRAHETAIAALNDVTKELETLRRHENELTELRTVEPLLRDHDLVGAELQSLAGIPDLAETTREERLAAKQTLVHAQQDLGEANTELERCESALRTLVFEPLVLNHADAIDRLVSGISAAAHHRIEVQQQDVLIEQILSNLEILIARLAPGRELVEVLQSVPSDADRVALDTHLIQVTRLGERVQGHRQRVEALDEASAPEAEELPVMNEPATRQALVIKIRQAQSLGDVVRQETDFDRQIHELECALETALSDLSAESEQGLRLTHPILEAQITLTKQKLSEIDEQMRNTRDEFQRVGRDLEEQKLRQRQLAAEGEVVTAESLRLARTRRDNGWSLIQQAYIEHLHNIDELAHSFDPDRTLPDAFEATVSEADRQADLLRADVKRAAGFEESSVRIEQMEARRLEIDHEKTALTTRRGELLAGWDQELSQAGLPNLDPETLPAWQERRHEALQLAERMSILRADRARLLLVVVESASSLVGALQELDQPVPERYARDANGLPALIEQALQWEKHAVQVEAEHSARLKTAQSRRIERDKVARLITETETELKRHQSALEVWHERLFIPSGSTPDVIKARLDELDNLVHKASALNEARQRKANLQAIVNDLINKASQVAALLGESPPIALDDFADQLRSRLAVARKGDQERSVLVRDQARAQKKKRLAELDQIKQNEVFSRLCAVAKVETIDKLPELEEAVARKRQVQKNLSLLREQLTKSSVRSEDELREKLSDYDAFKIDSECDRCRTEIKICEQKQNSARQTEEQTRRALEEIDTSNRAAIAREAMESAAASYRSGIRPWARLKFAHALLQQALNRFREQAQAPMVTAATSYFSLITGGVYERLVTDESEDKPVLSALRVGGTRIRVEEMSEGTADQLYLALRLAALELRQSSHPQMPLILDDALVTSDDTRAANILHALAQFAEGGQVMIFTHHHHLLEVARNTLGEQGFVFHEL